MRRGVRQKMPKAKHCLIYKKSHWLIRKTNEKGNSEPNGEPIVQINKNEIRRQNR